MTPMRRLMTIVEAKRQPRPPAAPQPSEAERAKAAIEQAVTAAIALKARAIEVAKQAQTAEHDLSRPFEQAWAVELREMISARLKQAETEANERFELDREDDPQATKQPIDRLGCMEEALAAFWEAKKDSLDWIEPDHSLRRYARANPKTELSDDITRLKDEHDLLSKISRSGGLGSITEMAQTLDSISNWASAIRNTFSEGWSDPSQATSALVLSGIPAMLFYCKLVAALSRES